MTSDVTLAVGILVSLWVSGLAGRLAGISITTLWSAATAYFLMAPAHSFRVSNWRDLVALGLCGTGGLVLSRKTSVKRIFEAEPAAQEIGPAPGVLIDLGTILMALTSSKLGEQLRQRGIHVAVLNPREFRCEYADGIRMLSHILAVALLEPKLRRVSLQTARHPEMDLLFVHALTVWPLPIEETIVIGKTGEDLSLEDVLSASELSISCFENGYGRIFQISRKIVT
jgi:hypothetical protein